MPNLSQTQRKQLNNEIKKFREAGYDVPYVEVDGVPADSRPQVAPLDEVVSSLKSVSYNGDWAGKSAKQLLKQYGFKDRTPGEKNRGPGSAFGAHR